MGYKKADIDASIAGKDEIRGGIPFWTPPAGEKKGKWGVSRIRILPPHEDHPDDRFYYWTATHGNLPGSSRPVLCPAKMHNRPCPACEAGNQLWQQGRKDDARKLFANFRAFVNIIVLDEDGNVPDGARIMVWGMPKTVAEDLLTKIEELPKKQRDITDVETGRDVIVRKKVEPGKSEIQGTKYEVSLAEDASPLPPEALELLEADNSLYLLTGIYQEIESARIAGLLAPPTPSDPFEDDDEGYTDAVAGTYRELDDDEDDEPAPPKKKASRPVDEDEDDEAPFDTDDEDDEPAPPKKKELSAADKQNAARERLLARLG